MSGFTLELTRSAWWTRLSILVIGIYFFIPEGLASATAKNVETGVRMVAESSSRASFTFQLPTLDHQQVFHDGERFDAFSFENDPSAGPEGWPELPSLVRFVLIPPQSGVELKVTNVRSHTLSNINPLPRQPLPYEGNALRTEASSAGSDEAPLIRDPNANNLNGYWPEEERLTLNAGRGKKSITESPNLRKACLTGGTGVIDW